MIWGRLSLPDFLIFSDSSCIVITCSFLSKQGQIVLDQIRAIDKPRLVNHMGEIQPDEQSAVLAVLGELFAE